MKDIQIRFRQEIPQKTVIGIVGVADGVGVTHLCLALAQYCARHKLQQTAVIELSGKHALAQMNTTKQEKRFQIGRITCFPDVRDNEMADLLNERYQIYLLDMGSDFYRVRQEFLRCDIRIVVGDLNPWKKSDYVNFVTEVLEEEDYESWEAFLMSHGGKGDRRDFQKQYHIPVYPIPYIENPFELKKESYTFLQGLLQ